MKTLEQSINEFVKVVNNAIAKDFSINYKNLTPPTVSVKNNRKYFKLTSSRGSVWGFIVKEDGILKNSYVKAGDLLKAANWRTPARGSRGNILNGTARWDVYGPSYNK